MQYPWIAVDFAQNVNSLQAILKVTAKWQFNSSLWGFCLLSRRNFPHVQQRRQQNGTVQFGKDSLQEDLDIGELAFILTQ